MGAALVAGRERLMLRTATTITSTATVMADPIPAQSSLVRHFTFGRNGTNGFTAEPHVGHFCSSLVLFIDLP